MRILYLSRSKTGAPHPFVAEQALALEKLYGLSIKHFLISDGGIKGYVKAINQFSRQLRENKVDLVHVHYGLSALVAVISRLIFFFKYKIIVTYHGSDLNNKSERPFSLLAASCSTHNIVVSNKMLKYFPFKCSVIPCGIDTNVDLIYRDVTRKEYGWGTNDYVILFSSSFERREKDPDFAKEVIKTLKLSIPDSVKFIELKGFNRNQLTRLMQAADVLLMCSKTEGSPQIIKEAILNSLPVVSNDVGDVKSICGGTDNCFIIQKKVEEFVKHLKLLAETKPRVQNRMPVIEKYSNNLIAAKLYNIYSKALA